MVTKKEKEQAGDRSGSGARGKPHTGGGRGQQGGGKNASSGGRTKGGGQPGGRFFMFVIERSDITFLASCVRVGRRHDSRRDERR